MRLAPHCHALAGFGYVPPWTVNAGLVCGEGLTLIVDTGPSAQAAATILGYAEVVRPTNVVRAINTERHLDHIAGNAFLRDHGIDISGHPTVRRTDAEFAEDVAAYERGVTDPKRRSDHEGRLPFVDTRIAAPNLDVAADLSMDLGGLRAEVLLVPGHTPANLAVWVPSDGVVFVGDTVVSGYRPNLESGGPADWRLWLESLDRISTLRPAILVPGHGRVLFGETEIRSEMARVRLHLDEALSDGRT